MAVNTGHWRSAEFETATAFEQVTDLVMAGKQGAPGRIRTSDTWFRKPLLYPLSYEGGMQRG